MSELSFEGRLYPWHEDRPDSWIFVALPSALSRRIDDSLTAPPKELDAYVLPVKKPVRRSEQLDVDDVATFTIRLLG